VLEVSETNNVTASAAIGIGPDLTVTVVTAPASAVRGTTVTVGDTSANTGAAAVGVTTTTYYLSGNKTVEATDVVLGSRTVIALGPGASHSGQLSVTIPAGHATGTHYVLAKTDSGNVVAESSESNNVTWKLIRIDP
jgi:subtilase family serine protease